KACACSAKTAALTRHPIEGTDAGSGICAARRFGRIARPMDRAGGPPRAVTGRSAIQGRRPLQVQATGATDQSKQQTRSTVGKHDRFSRVDRGGTQELRTTTEPPGTLRPVSKMCARVSDTTFAPTNAISWRQGAA